MPIKSIIEDDYYVVLDPNGNEIARGSKKDKRYVDIIEHGIDGEYRIIQPEVKVLIAGTERFSELPPNLPPEWTSTPAPSFTELVSGTYALSDHTFDTEVDTLTYSLNGASASLPSGVTLASNGVITADGTQVTGDTTGIIVDVDDGVNAAVASPSFTISVTSGIAAADYYVSSIGSDANDGLTPETAKLTVDAGIALMSSGEILEIAGGTYRGGSERWANAIPNGTASDYTIIRAADGETVTFLMADNGQYRPIDLGGSPSSTESYIEFQGLTFDSQDIVSAYSNAMKIEGPVHHTRWINCTFRRAHTSCVAIFDPHQWRGTIAGGYDVNRSLGQHYFRNCIFEESGSERFKDHGVYCNHHDCTFIGCIFRNNFSMGAQLYHSCTPVSPVPCIPGWHTDRQTVIGCLFYGNLDSGLICDGHDNQIYNNVSYNNGAYGIMLYYECERAKVYNNTCASNGIAQIASIGNSDFLDVRNNILWPGTAWSWASNGSNNTRVNNYTLDPSYVNAGAGNYRLDTGSSAIDQGETLGEVTDDFDGTSRPQGAAYDPGAFESG